VRLASGNLGDARQSSGAAWAKNYVESIDPLETNPAFSLVAQRLVKCQKAESGAGLASVF
jgi:hypothetical protein